MNTFPKAIIFDLDGVLIDATEWHYEALNRALKIFGFIINRDEHLSTYNGLSTQQKLHMLTTNKALPQSLHDIINKMKQLYTFEIINAKCRPDFEKQIMLHELKKRGYSLACCSNAIRDSVELMLKKAGLIDYFNLILSNQDVKKKKPDPDIYLTAFSKLNIKPEESLIIEDAPLGIQAAEASGGKVIKVRGYQDVNFGLFSTYINL